MSFWVMALAQGTSHHIALEDKILYNCISDLASRCNQLGCFKNYGCLGPIPRDSQMIGIPGDLGTLLETQ